MVVLLILAGVGVFFLLVNLLALLGWSWSRSKAPPR